MVVHPAKPKPQRLPQLSAQPWHMRYGVYEVSQFMVVLNHPKIIVVSVGTTLFGGTMDLPKQPTA